MQYLAAAWVAWVGWHFARMCLAAVLVTPTRACFDGFRVIIPATVRDALSPAELAAIIAHEHGHRHHLHVWANFARLCLFCRASPKRRYLQELQADDYAIARGHRVGLISALMKLSSSPQDFARVERMRSFS